MYCAHLLPERELEDELIGLEEEMFQAAEDLKFERAAELDLPSCVVIFEPMSLICCERATQPRF